VIKHIKGYFFLISQYRKQKKKAKYLKKATEHALISLSYWEKCDLDEICHFQIKGTSFYVSLRRKSDE